MKRFFTIIALFAVCLTVMAQTPRVKGDVDGDGSVTSADVTVLYNYLLNNETSGMQNGDVDGDGYVTSGDVTLVYNILLGIEPAEEEHEYVDLGLPSGTLWATTNVGASSPEDYEDAFAWGETTTKDFVDWSNYKWCNGTISTLTKYCNDSIWGYNGFTDDKTELDPEDDAATANWGKVWRTPSRDQIEELLINCTAECTAMNGVEGLLLTSSINGSSLFFPAAGFRWLDEVSYSGTDGVYASRTLRSDRPTGAYGLNFDMDGSLGWGGASRAMGSRVRAVRVPPELAL